MEISEYFFKLMLVDIGYVNVSGLFNDGFLGLFFCVDEKNLVVFGDSFFDEGVCFINVG